MVQNAFAGVARVRLPHSPSRGDGAIGSIDHFGGPGDGGDNRLLWEDLSIFSSRFRGFTFPWNLALSL